MEGTFAFFPHLNASRTHADTVHLHTPPNSPPSLRSLAREVANSAKGEHNKDTKMGLKQLQTPNTPSSLTWMSCCKTSGNCHRASIASRKIKGKQNINQQAGQAGQAFSNRLVRGSRRRRRRLSPDFHARSERRHLFGRYRCTASAHSSSPHTHARGRNRYAPSNLRRKTVCSREKRTRITHAREHEKHVRVRRELREKFAKLRREREGSSLKNKRSSITKLRP